MNRSIWLVLATIVLAAGCGVQSPLQVNTNSLPAASLQQSYSTKLSAIGTNPPFAWKLVSGSLPPGVSLVSNTGVISGTPQSEGDFDFAVEVNDATVPSLTARSASLKIRVRQKNTNGSLSVATTSLTGGTVQASYNAALAATGGTSPYQWTLSNGLLPPGITLGGSTGILSGTPTRSGQFSFTARVQDSSNPSEHATQNLSISIAPAGSSSTSSTSSTPSLQVATSSLPAGAVQVSYSAALAASGGTSPYSWSVIGGTFPPGLALSASAGSIGGTPTQAGTFLFTAQVKDSTGLTASSTLTANIAPASSPVITSISPASGPTSGGTTVTINGSNFASGASVSFGGTAASASVVSATQISAVSPAHVTGTVAVSVQENGQTSTLGSSFTYNALYPTVSAISPNSGPTAGGTTVTITGSNFLAGALVLFGGVSAPTVAVNSGAQIQVVTPPNAAGAVDVTVENVGNLSAKLSSGFTYESGSSGPPTITSVSPTSGTPGTQVTITGTNFETGATVAFGSTPAGSASFVSSTQLLATIPSVSAGTYGITVTDPDPASVTMNNAITVTAAQSLLAGATVSSSNQPSVAVPSGWTLVFADGFESGSFASGSEYTQGGTISSTNPHAGGKSVQCSIAYDGAACDVGVGPGTIGSSNHIYVSYWRYMDSNACGDTEIYFGDVYAGDRSQFFDVLDTQNYSSPLNTCATTMTDAFIFDGSAALNSGLSIFTNGSWNLPLGAWEQVEFEFQGSTCSGSTSNNDGLFRLYVNGALRQQKTNANLNGCGAGYSSVGMAMEAGGVFTYLNAAETGSIAPPNGSFHVYLDDVILLKQ